MSWLGDTFITTGALIVLVLILRRPVARWFGPGMAYALWALPLLRLVLPPLILPNQSAQAVPMPKEYSGEIVLAVTEPQPATLPLAEVLLALWFGGAVAFLAWRIWSYRRMRRLLLEGARPVGEAGDVRLVETAATPAPVAFGVRDKVVALPLGFMSRSDRAGRDLAIAHELEHHAGRDLAVNIAMQPLLALHWFNPLAWAGWRALRRDQEAACDARVLAGCEPGMRETYGRLIASFAQSPRMVLAAPMACPVLGDKSIVHRLRSLTMTEPSNRRRLAGRMLIGAAALALPLTATITYAASEQEAPAAPRSPAPPKVERHVSKIVIVDKEDGAEPDDPNLKTQVIERDGKTIVFKSDKKLSDAELEARIAQAEASMAKAEAELAESEARVVMLEAGADGKKGKHKRIVISGGEGTWAEARALGDGKVIVACADGTETAVAERATTDGKTEEIKLRFCGRTADLAGARKQALSALREARENIDNDEELSNEIRKKVIERLDAKIDELSKQG